MTMVVCGCHFMFTSQLVAQLSCPSPITSVLTGHVPGRWGRSHGTSYTKRIIFVGDKLGYVHRLDLFHGMNGSTVNQRMNHGNM